MGNHSTNGKGLRGRPRTVEPRSFLLAWSTYQSNALSKGAKPLWKDFCAHIGITSRRGRQIRTALNKAEEIQPQLPNGPSQSGNNLPEGDLSPSAEGRDCLRIPSRLAEGIASAFRGHGAHHSLGLSVRSAVLQFQPSNSEQCSPSDLYAFVMNLATKGRSSASLAASELDRCQEIAALAEATYRGRHRVG